MQYRQETKVDKHIQQIQTDMANMQVQESQLKTTLKNRESDRQQSINDIEYCPQLLEDYERVMA